MSFTLDRYGHLYPEADTALRDRLDALYGTGSAGARKHMEYTCVDEAGRGPSWPQAALGEDESAADDAPTTL